MHYNTVIQEYRAGCGKAQKKHRKLFLIMHSLNEGDGIFDVQDGLDFLAQDVEEETSDNNYGSRPTVPDSVLCVDAFVTMSLIEEEDGYLERWEQHAEDVANLLHNAERLFKSWAEKHPNEKHCRTEQAESARVALGQRLNAYCAIASALMDVDNGAEFKTRLGKAKEDVIANVDYLLSSRFYDAIEHSNFEFESSDGRDWPWNHDWEEPLALLAYASCAARTSGPLLRAYQDLVRHLENARVYPSGMRGYLLADCEHVIEAELLGGAVEDIYPQLPDPEHTELIHKLLSEHPTAPLLVKAGPWGEPSSYCDVVSVELVDFLDATTNLPRPAIPIMSREMLSAAAEEGVKMMSGKGLVDDEVAAAVEQEVKKWDHAWKKALLVQVTWREI